MTSSDASTGMQLAHHGRFGDALPYLERANRTDPLDIPVLNAVANLLVLAGRGHEVDERFRLASQMLPPNLNLLCGWARISLMMQNPAQAIDLFDQAFALEPRYANPGGWLEGILGEVADPDTTCTVLRALVERHPKHPGVLGVYARMLRVGERLEEAKDAFERYRALRPRDTWPRIELGGLAASQGELGDASEHFQSVLALEAGNADALWSIAEMNGWKLDGRMLAAVKRAIALKPALRPLARLHETLAKHHDRLGEFPASWRHAARANALTIEATSPRQRYDMGQHEGRVDILIRHHTRPLFDRLVGSGSRDPRPVFVVGLPRSGTTLLERMLASHPSVIGVGEQGFAESGWKRALAASGEAHDALSASAVESSAAWHLQMLEQRVRRLGLPADAQRIVDKLPDNYLMVGWLHLAFPDAAIVHVQRDPRAVAVSCWFSQFADVQWINELRYIAHRIEQHRRLMRHWRATLGKRLIEVQYENLVTDPATELRRVLAAMGMEWHPDVTCFADRKGYVGSISRQQVREPVHGRSVDRWRNYEHALLPIMDRLNAIVAQDEREADALPRVELDTIRT